MGKNVVKRKIPFTPMMKRMLPYIDFKKAKNVNLNTLQTTMKRLYVVIVRNHVEDTSEYQEQLMRHSQRSPINVYQKIILQHTSVNLGCTHFPESR